MMRQRCLFLGLCALLISNLAGEQAGATPAAVPSARFITPAQLKATLASHKGRVVVLHLWATWCLPCVEELPSLLVLQHRLPQITVLAISQDEDPAAYRRFLLDYRVNLLTLRDPSARIPRLYGTVKLPETYIIDRNGILRRKFVSAQNLTSPEILDYLSKL